MVPKEGPDPISDLQVSSADDVAAAFDTARQAQRQWRDIPVRDHERVMLRFHDLLLASQDEVPDLIQAENGKTRRDAFLEVADIALTSRVLRAQRPRPAQAHRGTGPGPPAAPRLRASARRALQLVDQNLSLSLKLMKRSEMK